MRKLLMGVVSAAALLVGAVSASAQGTVKIGLILSGKPQERRRLIEEAAGITRYKARKKIAEEVYPEYNPTDPTTGAPQDTFKYWPDEVRLWGVEVTVTAIATRQSQYSYQTAGSEVYLRNL